MKKIINAEKQKEKVFIEKNLTKKRKLKSNYFKKDLKKIKNKKKVVTIK